VIFPISVAVAGLLTLFHLYPRAPDTGLHTQVIWVKVEVDVPAVGAGSALTDITILFDMAGFPDKHSTGEVKTHLMES
jgi:hypothetical protein